MGKNHRNRSWRAQWTCEPADRIAVHKSGVIARVGPSPADAAKEGVTLERTEHIDRARWDLGTLSEQAFKLWMQGEFG